LFHGFALLEIRIVNNDTIYVPNLAHPELYCIVRTEFDIYGLCGEQVNNSTVDGVYPVTRELPKDGKVHPACQKILDDEKKAADEAEAAAKEAARPHPEPVAEKAK
jgi:hypothetical protein